MATALDDLMTLVPPPPGVVKSDWEGVILPGGVAPPPDYRALVDAHGTGVFDDFLWVLVPKSPNRYLNLEYQTAGVARLPARGP